MASYVHKTLKCLVTEKNYTDYGIPSLDDPNMYLVLDMPEVDFLDNDIIFGEPTFDEEKHTAFLHPTVTPISEQYKQDIIEQHRKLQYENFIRCFSSELRKNIPFTHNNISYLWAFDFCEWFSIMNATIDRLTENNTYKLGFSLPVLHPQNDGEDEQLVVDFVYGDLLRIYEDMKMQMHGAAINGKNIYVAETTSVTYENLANKIRQQAAVDPLIPQDPFTTVKYNKDGNRTVTTDK